MRFLGILTLLLISNVNAFEKEVVLNYDGFFDRMDDLNEPEFVDIKLAFYFNEIGQNQACPILRSEIRTKLDSMDVYFLDSGEVLLPFDEQLDLDKAKLVIVTQDDVDCGLNMRLEASFLIEQEVQTKRAVSLVKTFDAGLKELSGMMSFLSPDVTGVTFIGKEEEPLLLQGQNASFCERNKCTLTSEQLESTKGELYFNHAPLKIVPFIQR